MVRGVDWLRGGSQFGGDSTVVECPDYGLQDQHKILIDVCFIQDLNIINARDK